MRAAMGIGTKEPLRYEVNVRARVPNLGAFFAVPSPAEDIAARLEVCRNFDLVDNLDLVIPVPRALTDPICRGLVVGASTLLRLLANGLETRPVHVPLVHCPWDRHLAPHRAGRHRPRVHLPQPIDHLFSKGVVVAMGVPPASPGRCSRS